MRWRKVLGNVTQEMKGLEIAPFHNPLVPKSQGWNVKILDVFDTEKLMEISRSININTRRIEPVDYVCNACDLAEHIDEQFDYICSSHNFEHLPDPIKFLQGAHKLLKPGGILAMAIPDMRYCFDVFKWPTQTIDIIKSYHQKRTLNDPYENFRYQRLHVPGHVGNRPTNYNQIRKLKDIHDEMIHDLENPSDEYKDIHTGYYTPNSFVLLIEELSELGYVNYQIEHLEATQFEFFIRLTPTDRIYDIPESHRADKYNEIVKELANK